MSYKKYFPIFFLLFLGLSCQNTTSSTATTEAKETPKEVDSPIISSEKPAATKQKTILFFGNSLTAGLGVDPQDAFVGVIGKKLSALKMPYGVVNSGVSGETTAGGLGRIEWILEQYQPAIFVLELGGNDALRGVDPAASSENLQSIIDVVKKKFPEIPIVLAGMEAPPNMGETFRNAFREMYRDLAKKNNLLLIPFLLDGVGGVPEYNQKDGIHPTEEGHKIVAEVVWKVLEKAL